MKYKGKNKIYFGIGLRDDFRTCCGIEFYFYFFKLIQEAPIGEMLKGKRDYNGFLISKVFRLPNWGINI